MSDKLAAELVARCFAARTHAHILHLSTTSYAEHEALGSFYGDLIPLVDDFAETYMGTRGGKRLTIEFLTVKPTVTAKQMLEFLCRWLDDNRDEIGMATDTHLQNIIDEIHQLVSQTIYKLTLK